MSFVLCHCFCGTQCHTEGLGMCHRASFASRTRRSSAGNNDSLSKLQWSPLPRRCWCHLRRREVYTRVGENLPQSIWRLDNSLHWTGKSLLDCSAGRKRRQVCLSEDSKCLELGKAGTVHLLVVAMVNDAMEKLCGNSPASIKGEKLIGITIVARSGARVWKWQSRVLRVEGGLSGFAEHPFTAISCASEVHSNHNEAQNNCSRRSRAYRRRQNLYAKRVQGLQRALMCNDWCITGASSLGLGKSTTPAMAMSFCNRPCQCMNFWLRGSTLH